MKPVLISLLALLLVALPQSGAAAESAKPYTGQVLDKSLSATDAARMVLLSGPPGRRDWTLEQWHEWADARFGSDTSPDGTTWRDWKKLQIKNKSDSTLVGTELSRPATSWSPDDWNRFVDYIDYDYQSADKYACVILPSGQQRGTYLMGRWAYSMYEDDLSERQTWENFGGESASMNLEQLERLSQMQVEVTTLVAGLICALILACTWKW